MALVFEMRLPDKFAERCLLSCPSVRSCAHQALQSLLSRGAGSPKELLGGPARVQVGQDRAAGMGGATVPGRARTAGGRESMGLWRLVFLTFIREML